MLCVCFTHTIKTAKSHFILLELYFPKQSQIIISYFILRNLYSVVLIYISLQSWLRTRSS